MRMGIWPLVPSVGNCLSGQIGTFGTAGRTTASSRGWCASSLFDAAMLAEEGREQRHILWGMQDIGEPGHGRPVLRANSEINRLLCGVSSSRVGLKPVDLFQREPLGSVTK